ncbi:nicotinamidase-related amidase [Comamonas sp. BIGb0124]|uniref:cysteine hydrolase n=1 Tax=Comamonas sp. BIGb0124 TaxID=2485130 RepID=UPI000F4A4A0F|nr:cysteine hydrolase [Comamonas sp. BIGb0124]ROR23080.1 nicotinamidase-related amidase [Comamonas sp. BIGb0124]
MDGQQQEVKNPAPFKMPQYVMERVMKKRGRLRVFENFDPRETALVVVDMQDFYVRDVPNALAIIPNINRLAREFRSRGAKVAWVNMVAGEGGRSLWPLYHDFFFSPENGRRHRDNLTKGHPGQAVHGELETRPEDVFADKRRFSAFIPQHSDLHERLQDQGIRNVAITGMLTNFCCETSARDAMMLDYHVAMISDANAARYDEDHNIGFTTVFQSFGDVVTVDEMLDEILKPPSGDGESPLR